MIRIGSTVAAGTSSEKLGWVTAKAVAGEHSTATWRMADIAVWRTVRRCRQRMGKRRYESCQECRLSTLDRTINHQHGTTNDARSQQLYVAKRQRA